MGHILLQTVKEVHAVDFRILNGWHANKCAVCSVTLGQSDIRLCSYHKWRVCFEVHGLFWPQPSQQQVWLKSIKQSSKRGKNHVWQHEQACVICIESSRHHQCKRTQAWPSFGEADWVLLLFYTGPRHFETESRVSFIKAPVKNWKRLEWVIQTTHPKAVYVPPCTSKSVQLLL